MNADVRPEMPREQIVYGEIVYWITVVSCIICTVGPLIAMINVENNILNPHYLFANIFEGKNAQAIWQEVGGGFPGGHFYLKNFTTGDGFTQFGLALGCSVALWALLASAVVYISRKIYLYFFLSLWVAFLVFVSMVGLAGMH
jgi:hypothetical protein